MIMELPFIYLTAVCSNNVQLGPARNKERTRNGKALMEQNFFTAKCHASCLYLIHLRKIKNGNIMCVCLSACAEGHNLHASPLFI